MWVTESKWMSHLSSTVIWTYFCTEHSLWMLYVTYTQSLLWRNQYERRNDYSKQNMFQCSCEHPTIVLNIANLSLNETECSLSIKLILAAVFRFLFFLTKRDKMRHLIMVNDTNNLTRHPWFCDISLHRLLSFASISRLTSLVLSALSFLGLYTFSDFSSLRHFSSSLSCLIPFHYPLYRLSPRLCQRRAAECDFNMNTACAWRVGFSFTSWAPVDIQHTVCSKAKYGHFFPICHWSFLV